MTAESWPVARWRVRVLFWLSCVCLVPLMVAGFGGDWLIVQLSVIQLMACVYSLLNCGGSADSTCIHHYDHRRSKLCQMDSISHTRDSKSRNTSQVAPGPMKCVSLQSDDAVTTLAENTSKIADTSLHETNTSIRSFSNQTVVSKHDENGGSNLKSSSVKQLSNDVRNGCRSLSSPDSAIISAQSAGKVARYYASNNSSSHDAVSVTDSASPGACCQLSLGRKASYGWSRFQVLSQLVSFLLATALCFSLAVESIERLVNPEPQEAPTSLGARITPLIASAVIVMLHGIAVLAVGGFGRLQALVVWPQQSSVDHTNRLPVRCGYVARDIFIPLLALTVSLLSYFHYHRPDTVTGSTTHPGFVVLQRYIDPAITLLAIAFLIVSGRVVALASCRLLLQAQPPAADSGDLLSARLASVLLAGRHVLAVHELHVWQLTPSSTVLTAHVLLNGALLQQQSGRFTPPLEHQAAEKEKQLMVGGMAAVNQQLLGLTQQLRRLGVNRISLQPEFVSVSANANDKDGSDGGGSGSSGGGGLTPDCQLACSTPDQCADLLCCRPSSDYGSHSPPAADHSSVSALTSCAPGAKSHAVRALQQHDAPGSDSDPSFVAIDLSPLDVDSSRQNAPATSLPMMTSFVNESFQP